MDNYQNHSQEAEECVIACVLDNPIVLVNVLENLDESDFFLTATRTIFSAIKALDSERQPIEPMLVIQKLSSMGLLADAGGLGYLAQIASSVATSGNVMAYAKIVKDKSKERAMIQIAREMINEIMTSTEDTDTKLNNAQSMQLSASHVDAKEKDTDQFLKESAADLQIRHEADGKITGLETKYAALDKRFYGLQPGQLMILAGRPSSGKTTLALNIALNAMFDNSPGAVVFFSLEMTGRELMDKMVCCTGNIDHTLYRAGLPKCNPLSAVEFPKITPAFQRIKEAGNLVTDDRSGITFQQIRSKAIRMKRKHGSVKVIFVDYLTLIRTPGKDNRVLEVGALSRGLKGLAKELECPVICLAQLSRKVEERADKRPIMHDLRDSGEIEQDADIVTMIYRDEYYTPDSERKGIAEIITVKNRAGITGVDYLGTDLGRSKFRDLPEDYQPPENRNKGKAF